MELTHDEIEAWETYALNKACQHHPTKIVKKGKWGAWCGERSPRGVYCDGGWPTDEWLNDYRNGQLAYDKEVKNGTIIKEQII